MALEMIIDKLSATSLEEKILDAIEDNLHIIADNVSRSTPVDTGALLDSMYIENNVIGFDISYAYAVNSSGIHAGFIEDAVEEVWDQFVQAVNDDIGYYIESI